MPSRNPEDTCGLPMLSEALARNVCEALRVSEPDWEHPALELNLLSVLEPHMVRRLWPSARGVHGLRREPFPNRGTSDWSH